MLVLIEGYYTFMNDPKPQQWKLMIKERNLTMDSRPVKHRE